MAVPVREPHRDYVGEKCAPRARPLTVHVNPGPQALSTSGIASLFPLALPLGLGRCGPEDTSATIRCDLTSVCLLECVQCGMCTRVTRCVLSTCCGNDTPGPSPQPSHPPSLSLSSMLVAVCPHHLLRCRSWLSPGKAPRAPHALQRRPQPRPVRRRSSRTNDVTRGSAGNGCASQREHGVSSADLPGARFVAQHANVAVVHPQHVLHLVRDLK